MAQGRKTLSEITDSKPVIFTELPPPDRLTDEEQALWRSITARKPADWFGAEHIPLLEQFCVISCQLRRLDEAIRVLPVGDDGYHMLYRTSTALCKQQAALATKMRLTHQAQWQPERAATASKRAIEAHAKRRGAEKPWEFTAQ